MKVLKAEHQPLIGSAMEEEPNHREIPLAELLMGPGLSRIKNLNHLKHLKIEINNPEDFGSLLESMKNVKLLKSLKLKCDIEHFSESQLQRLSKVLVQLKSLKNLNWNVTLVN